MSFWLYHPKWANHCCEPGCFKVGRVLVIFLPSVPSYPSHLPCHLALAPVFPYTHNLPLGLWESGLFTTCIISHLSMTLPLPTSFIASLFPVRTMRKLCAFTSYKIPHKVGLKIDLINFIKLIYLFAFQLVPIIVCYLLDQHSPLAHLCTRLARPPGNIQYDGMQNYETWQTHFLMHCGLIGVHYAYQLSPDTLKSDLARLLAMIPNLPWVRSRVWVRVLGAGYSFREEVGRDVAHKQALSVISESWPPYPVDDNSWVWVPRSNNNINYY